MSQPAEKYLNSPWVRWISPFQAALERMPARCRPALFYETFYNVGSGAFVAVFGLSLAALKSEDIFGSAGTKEHLMLIAAMFGGSSLLSPLVGYMGRFFSMRSLVIVPNLVTAALLFVTGIWRSADLFALIIGSAFVIRVFPRVAEMNMFRVLYPSTHRSGAVGWVKSIACIAGLLGTTAGTLWFLWQPTRYFWIYWLVAGALAFSALMYARIPVGKQSDFKGSRDAPYLVLWRGVRIFLGDRRFLLYQVGFWFAGFGNHMAHAYIAESLKEDVGASDWTIFALVALIPALIMASAAPVWGRLLDRINPMSGRAIFNGLQFVGYTFHFAGGYTQQVWPFVVGATIQAVGNAGGTINWLTGSLYFASRDRVSLYNSIHVGLTGLRGLTAPILGVWIYGSELTLGRWTVTGLGLGPGLFALSAGLSLFGSLFMIWLAQGDQGPAEEVTLSNEQLAESARRRRLEETKA